ncbi:MAG: hypothetical protein IBX71_06760 [Candidatus Desulforudis sp.]|nr:hypothetical protein [Desulforudis sp.]
MRRLVAGLLILLLALSLGACGEKTFSGPLRLAVELSLDAEERAFVVGGDTNVPEGAKLMVIVQRVQAPFLVVGMADAVVAKGRYETRLPYAEDALVPGLYQALVSLTPLEQNEDVLAVIGAEGEHIPELGVEDGEIVEQDQPVKLVYLHGWAMIEVE